jgi:potassium-dependent mechanosensitive channel
MQIKTGRTLYRFLILFLIYLCCYPAAVYAQSQTPTQDTVMSKEVLRYLLKNPSSWIRNNINKLNSTTLVQPSGVDTMEVLRSLRTINNANEMIRRNLDYNSISMRSRQALDLKNQIQAGIADLERIQSKIVQNNNYLLKEISNTLSIEKEIAYFNTHADSTIISIYKPEIEMLDSTLNSTGNYFTTRLQSLVRIEDSINYTSLRLQASNRSALSLIHQIELIQKRATLPPLWKSGIKTYPHTFVETVRETLRQTIESFEFFLRHNITGLIFYRILLFGIALLPVYYFRRNKGLKTSAEYNQKYLQKYPSLASGIMGLAIAPIVFNHAPFAFLDLIFISLTLCVSILYLKEHDYLPRKPYYLLIASFILLILINFFTTPTFAGRLIFSLSIALILPMLQVFRAYTSKFPERKKRSMIIFGILLLQLSSGWVLILLGFYPQGRAFFLGAIDAFVLALVLNVTLMTFIDYLRILTFTINHKSKTYKIDHQIIEKSIRKILVFLAFVYFIIAYLKNLDLFDGLAGWISTWIAEPRTLGDVEFTYWSIFLFVGNIAGGLFIASLISRAIDTDDVKVQYKRKSPLGSILLLLRFSIITLGFIIGIIASGIPLTQVTVLMGALGVGIGFGLQNIFNNLVSGLIIAIDRPVSVGDMVELGKDTGWIRQIGIRSSSLQTFDGAEVIVPNGELISNRVTNWTLTNRRRRMEIMVGVAYKSDPHQVFSILTAVLGQHHEVLTNPEPFILFKDMGESSLNFSMHFWIADFVEGRRIRSEVLFQVFDALKENGIEIPFPQRDLHLRSIDPEINFSNRSTDMAES